MAKRLPQNYIPTHYELYIHIEERKSSFDSIVTITFEKKGDSNILQLNVDPSIVITRITQNESELKYSVDYPILTIERSPQLDFTSSPITIEYKVTPATDDDEGFFIYNGNYLTEFEPNLAQKLFPCFDEPCVRSTFSVKLLIPSYLTALSNMPAERITAKETESEIIFAKSPPMCTYLLCICVGSFSSIIGSTDNGTMVEFFTTTGREEYLRTYLDVAIFSLNWLETKFGVKYELPHLQLVSLEGFPGGMENYGLITLNDYTKSRNKLYYITVIMHEITHQWFGNLVCIKYWDSLWLNEGFAEFIQYLILKDYRPEIDISKKFASDEGIDCFQYFEYGVIVPNESDIDFDSLFDLFVYSKGAFVVKMFYDLIGDESFYKVCSNYLNEFKNKCADVNNFIQIVNSTLNKDFTQFFNAWLRNYSFPVLIVNEVVDDSKNVGITITQICQSNCVYNFNVPIVYEKDGKMFKKSVMIDGFFLQIDFEFDWVIVNDDIASLCFVAYSENLLNSLLELKNQNKISYLNIELIKKSVNNDTVANFVDTEVIELAGKF